MIVSPPVRMDPGALEKTAKLTCFPFSAPGRSVVEGAEEWLI